MYKRYVVRLTEKERGQLETLVRRGRAHARKLLYASSRPRLVREGAHLVVWVFGTPTVVRPAGMFRGGRMACLPGRLEFP